MMFPTGAQTEIHVTYRQDTIRRAVRESRDTARRSSLRRQFGLALIRFGERLHGESRAAMPSFSPRRPAAHGTLR